MCPVVSLTQMPGSAKACSGRCISTCGILPQVWVLAACEGRISLFSKDIDGRLTLLPHRGSPVAASLDEFRAQLSDALSKGKVAQLVLVGAAHDLRWMQMSLPDEAIKHVVAEIEYPLLPVWFHQKPELKQLTQAIEQLLRV